MLETIWNAVNSPLAIALLAAVVLWLLNRLYAAKPAWQKYEGAIISAIKYAEKAIPDDAENKALARFDAAMIYALKVIREMEKRRLTDKEVASINDGIRVMHADLEATGGLAGGAG